VPDSTQHRRMAHAKPYILESMPLYILTVKTKKYHLSRFSNFINFKNKLKDNGRSKKKLRHIFLDS
jgi:ligand-binding sensor protein